MNPTTRANFLPEQRFLPLRPALQEHLAKVGAAISPENFLSICDEMLLKVLRDTFERIAANEGSICLVVASENAFIENQVYKNKSHSTALNKKLGKTTYAMIAVPLYFLNQVRGVISCVQLFDVLVEEGQAAPVGRTPPGFSP